MPVSNSLACRCGATLQVSAQGLKICRTHCSRRTRDCSDGWARFRDDRMIRRDDHSREHLSLSPAAMQFFETPHITRTQK